MVHIALEYFAPSLPRECRNAFKEVGERFVLNVMHEQPNEGAKIIVNLVRFLDFLKASSDPAGCVGEVSGGAEEPDAVWEQLG